MACIIYNKRLCDDYYKTLYFLWQIEENFIEV